MRNTVEQRSPLAEFRAPDSAWPGPALFPSTQWVRRRRLVPLVPWTLHRYMTGEILRIVVVSLVAVSILYSAATAYQVVRSGLQLTFIWPFLLKTIAYPLYFSIPMSLLFGVTLTAGRMVADLEVSSMRSHGVSHLQLYSPVLALALGFAVLGYVVNGWIVPRLYHEKRNLQQYILRQLENLGSGVNRTILLPSDGGSLLVGEYQGTHLRRVHIDLNRSLQSRFVPAIRDQLPRKLPEKITILAQEGHLQIAQDRNGVLLRLRGVELLVPETISGTPRGHDRFHQKLAITKALTIPLSFERKKPRLKDQTQPELNANIARLEEKVAEQPDDPALARALDKAVSEWHRRLAFSLSSITFSLIGISLCFLLDRRSRLIPFFAGTFTAVIVFYPLLMVGSYMGEKGIVPALALALPNLALLGLGIYLLRKAIRQ